MNDSYWSIFKDNFIEIIKSNEYYSNIFDFLQKSNNNALLYGSYGFPTDLFIDEVLKHKFNTDILYKKECVCSKNIPYYHNQHFIEINCMHPMIPKDLSIISKFILNIITNKNINDDKHLIVIKHIDIFNSNDFNSLRIILERFSNNVYFLCTTHKLDKIDVPVKSRFALFRIPLFSHIEIKEIFSKYFKIPLNKYLEEEKTRDIIKSIYIAHQDEKICTNDFCLYNFPPIFEFYKSFKKKGTLNDIRQFSYKCFQFNISISELLFDLLKLLPNNQKTYAIEIASKIDHIMQGTNKGRESLYIESFLCQVLL